MGVGVGVGVAVGADGGVGVGVGVGGWAGGWVRVVLQLTIGTRPFHECMICRNIAGRSRVIASAWRLPSCKVQRAPKQQALQVNQTSL